MLLSLARLDHSVALAPSAEKQIATESDEGKQLAAQVDIQSGLLENLRRDSNLNQSMVHHLQRTKADALAASKQELEQVTAKISQAQEQLAQQQARADAALQRLEERKNSQPGFAQL